MYYTNVYENIEISFKITRIFLNRFHKILDVVFNNIVSFRPGDRRIPSQ